MIVKGLSGCYPQKQVDIKTGMGQTNVQHIGHCIENQFNHFLYYHGGGAALARLHTAAAISSCVTALRSRHLAKGGRIALYHCN